MAILYISRKLDWIGLQFAKLHKILQQQKLCAKYSYRILVTGATLNYNRTDYYLVADCLLELCDAQELLTTTENNCLLKKVPIKSF